MNRLLFAWVAAVLPISPARGNELTVGDECIVTAGRLVTAPRAAFGGSYLIVWQEGAGGVSATADIKGLRLKAGTLEPLDREPIAICTAPEAQEAPAVAYAEGSFLVVWQDFRNGKDYDVRGALIDGKTGKPRGGELLLAGGPQNQARPAVASDGKGFLVVWQEAAGGSYGIRGLRVSPAGKVLDETPALVAEAGASPAVAGAEGQFLVTWATGVGNRVGTAGALIDGATGQVRKQTGTINPCCGEGTVVTPDGRGGFLTVSAREGYPNPWGWPGPGAVAWARVNPDGTAPEGKLDYGYRFGKLTTREVPNVVDAATWKGAKTWNAGAPGGFPGTQDGLWPHGSPAVVRTANGSYLVAWVKGTVAGDRLNLTNLDVWVRGLDGKTLAARLPERKVAAAPGADETRPTLVGGPGEILLLYERLAPGEPRRVAARLLRVRAATEGGKQR